MAWSKIFKKIYSLLFVKLYEKSYGRKGKYMFINKHTDTLLIVFSAFGGEKPRYNYFSSLMKSNISQLYILDNYGHRGSYYLYENGSDFPETDTTELIRRVIDENRIKKVITAGTSKGGTCAIYYGLRFKAEHIFAGACSTISVRMWVVMVLRLYLMV